MKNFFPGLYENDRLKAQIGARILQGTLAHAYLIQGPRGTGKHLFAHLLAAAISCERLDSADTPLPCGNCSICRKIMADNSPDLLFVNRGENATIGIETIRRMKEDIYLSPSECKKKVYVIEEAEKMTPAAQNALLIVLEEPPPDVLLLLLSEDASSLVPTVHSRVQTLRMSLFDEEAMRRFLGKEAEAVRLQRTEPTRYQALLRAANGSPGRARMLLDPEEQKELLSERKTTLSVLDTLHNRADFRSILQATASLSQKRNDLIAELSLLLLAFRDLILLKRDENVPLCFYDTRENAEDKSEQISLRALVRLYDVTDTCIQELQKNGNVSVLLSAWRQDLLLSLSQH